MASPNYTFNPTPVTPLDEVRVHIGDITLGDGPAPNRDNLTDELITYFLEAGGGVIGAVALAFDHLAALWVSRPIFGPGELSTIHVDMYRKYHQAAADWRARFPAATGGAGDGELAGNAGYPAVTFTVLGVDRVTGEPTVETF